MNSRTSVSIVTTSLNQGEFIKDNILSVKNQDYPNIEHVIIDGGSTDNTLKILKEYEDKYNLKWISEPDEGQANAANKGFGMTNGDIIGWLNSDDVYLFRNSLSKAVEFFHESECDIIYGDRATIDENNSIKKIICPPRFNYDKLIQKRMTLPEPSTFFKRKIIENYKLDESLDYCFDYDYWIRICEKHKCGYVPFLFSGFRKHEKSKTVAQPQKFALESKRLAEKYGQSFGLGFKIKRLSDILTTTPFCRMRSIKWIERLKHKEFAIDLDYSLEEVFKNSLLHGVTK